METKKDIRKRIIQIRAGLTQTEQQEKSERIQKKLIETKEYIQAPMVLLYMNYHDEVQTGMIFEDCLYRKKPVAVPKVISDGKMEFFVVHGREDLGCGYRGIPEPITTQIAKAEQALVVMPGVAFDREGYRIGYGKGFYDRYLQQHPCYQTIALSYDCQIVSHVPREEHDRRMGKLMTEREEMEW